jgi:phosphate:Na+ symporter
LQNSATAKDITFRLNQLIAANRNTMYAAKSVKDAFSDIRQLRNSSNNIKYEFYKQASEKVDSFFNRITEILQEPDTEIRFKKLVDIYKSVTESYTEVLRQLYSEKMHKHLNETEISTLINFNREMYTSYKSFVFALRDYLLDEKQSAYFEELPGFIR